MTRTRICMPRLYCTSRNDWCIWTAWYVGCWLVSISNHFDPGNFIVGLARLRTQNLQIRHSPYSQTWGLRRSMEESLDLYMYHKQSIHPSRSQSAYGQEYFTVIDPCGGVRRLKVKRWRYLFNGFLGAPDWFRKYNGVRIYLWPLNDKTR